MFHQLPIWLTTWWPSVGLSETAFESKQALVTWSQNQFFSNRSSFGSTAVLYLRIAFNMSWPVHESHWYHIGKKIPQLSSIFENKNTFTKSRSVAIHVQLSLIYVKFDLNVLPNRKTTLKINQRNLFLAEKTNNFWTRQSFAKSSLLHIRHSTELTIFFSKKKQKNKVPWVNEKIFPMPKP